ncbi:MAG: DUF1634 domain-containing protein [Planctomycetes bacterium]|nr:DUF1634 domain-containing protein [Planctomycetota bacterium]
MEQPRHGWTDHEVEQFVGNLLRAGVLISATVVLLGALLFLFQSGNALPNYDKSRGEPETLRSLSDILQDALSLDGEGVIQLGLLLLVATPVSRVAFSVLAFALQRDRLYVVITLVVLAILVESLIGLH